LKNVRSVHIPVSISAVASYEYQQDATPIFRCKHNAKKFPRLWARSQNGEKLLLVSSSLSIRMEQFGSHWADFREILYLHIFRKYVLKTQVSLNSNKNNGYFT